MSTLTKFLFSLNVVLCLGGCSEEPTTSQTQYTIQDVFPLTVGNNWRYAVHSYDKNGTTTDIDSSTISVDSTIGTGSNIAFWTQLGDDKPHLMYYSGPELIAYENDGTLSDVRFKYPMSVNEVIVLEDTVRSSGTHYRKTMSLISDNTPITVPAGTFDCITYEYLSMSGKGSALDTTSMMQYHMGFGVGIVQRDIYTWWPDSVKYLWGSFKLVRYTTLLK